MENIVFKYSIEQLDENAEKYFDAMCGFTNEKPKSVAMKILSTKLKTKIKDSIQVRGIYSTYSNTSLDDGKLIIKDMDFTFNRLSTIDKESIFEIIPYIISAGNFELDDNFSMLDRFYADTYGTAYVDAARECLKLELLKSAKDKKEYKQRILNSTNCKRDLFISESIGPGFYGIELSEMQKYFTALDASIIEVMTNDYNVMIPSKSCVGLFVIADDSKFFPDYDCISCSTKETNCIFCMHKHKERNNDRSSG
jgi:hypothetical protein